MKSITVACAVGLTLAPVTAWSKGSVAGGLPDLAARIAALEGPTSVDVRCPAQSLAAAVSRAVSGRPVTITVSGRCTEPMVVVERDDVTIEGATRADGVDGQIRIVGARRVTLRSLTVENLDGTAVNIREGASATLTDVTAIGDLESAPNSGNDGYGIAISRQAYAQLTRVDARVLSGGNNALLMTDGATARSVDGSFISESDTPFDNTAIGLFRKAALRMDGSPVIENRNSLAGSEPTLRLAIVVGHTSNLRIDDEIPRIGGTVRIVNNSAARMRRLGGPTAGDGILDGGVLLGWDSNLELGTRTTLTVTGFVGVFDQSQLIVTGPEGSISTSNGLHCSGPSAGIQHPATLTPFPSGAGCSLF